MAKRNGNSDSIVKVTPNQLPDYLRDKQVRGVEALEEYVIVPRLKIIQKQSSSEALAKFGVGDVLIIPTEQVIAKMPIDEKTRRPVGELGGVFYFTPLFFYTTWATLNDNKMRGKEATVLYETENPNDPIASKARNKSLREEAHPRDPSLRIRHVERLNYICCVQNNPDLRDPFLMTFERSDHWTGSFLASLIKQRNASPYACVFQAQSMFRKKDTNDWYGLTVQNPQDESISGWVSVEQHDQFEKDHEKYQDLFNKKRLRGAEDPDAGKDEGDAPPTAERRF